MVTGELMALRVATSCLVCDGVHTEALRLRLEDLLCAANETYSALAGDLYGVYDEATCCLEEDIPEWHLDMIVA